MAAPTLTLAAGHHPGQGGSNEVRLIIGIAVMAAMLLPSAVSAEPTGGLDVGRGTFLSLPPDLSTRYLEAHYPHRDPFHPDAEYRHRRLSTATEHGVDRFNGQREVIPAGDLCAFEVTIRTWGKVPWWDWTTPEGDPSTSWPTRSW
jgi:hypothetical protein